MTDLNLQSKQLETVLSQQIQALYKQQLNHQLSELTCNAFDDTIVIVMQGVTTRPEQLLTESDHQELAQKMRQVLDGEIRPKIKRIIEEVLSVQVIDFLYDTKIETGRAGVIAVFELQSQNATTKIRADRNEREACR